MPDAVAPIAAILAMTAVTYGLRAGGYWIMGRVRLTARVRRGLEALPGAIIVATILPVAAAGGPSAMIGIAVAGLAMTVLRQDLSAVAFGLAAAALARSLGL